MGVWTGGDSRKAQLLRQVERFSLCVQKESQPYKYVSVEGSIVSMEAIDFESELRPLIFRYLNQEEGEQFLASLGDKPGIGDVYIRMKPERWLTQDCSKSQ